MYFPSITVVIGTIFMIYVSYSVYTLSQLFSTLQCTSTPCYKTILARLPKLQLNLFVSTVSNPLTNDVTKIGAIENFDYYKELTREFSIDIPPKTYRNGTMYLHMVLVNDIGVEFEWRNLKREGLTVLQRIPLTEYIVPRPATFNLLNDQNEPESVPPKQQKPVAHWKPKVFVTILTDDFSVSNIDIPPEMGRLLRITKSGDILPIIQNNFLKTRLSDLIELNSNTTKMPLTFNYSPISIGKLRLILHVEHAMRSLKQFGFTKKDVDEVKGIFSEANLYLLCGTMLIASVHLLFDFLSFKNDISFWRKKKSYVGLSLRTTLWRAFSQIVIFLYLLDEHTSLLVTIPAGIATVIELWKSKKMLKLEISWKGIRVKPSVEDKSVEKAEALTKEIDRQGMRYLSYLLYPLCLAGAVYSLIYQPHKSWYSWTLNSLVNGVYAFGFLFMLPQLFVNYKLKSVAALPWRAFMYKAFNTFIDDIFAFIITMPTAHRLACFRDDIVFLIYLYQRWLYPVDKNRMDDGRGEFTESDATVENTSEAKSKKTN